MVKFLIFSPPDFQFPSADFGIELHVSFFFHPLCYHQVGRNWLLPSVQLMGLINDFVSNSDVEESSFAHGSAHSTH